MNLNKTEINLYTFVFMVYSYAEFGVFNNKFKI